MLREAGAELCVEVLLGLARDAIVTLRAMRSEIGANQSGDAHVAEQLALAESSVQVAFDELDELDFPTALPRAAIQAGELQAAIEQLEQASIRVRFARHDMAGAGDALFEPIPVDGSLKEQHERRLIETLIEMLSSIPRWPATEAELGSGRKDAAHRVAGFIGANKPALSALVDECRAKLPLPWRGSNADEVLGRFSPHAWHVVPLGYQRAGSIRVRQRAQWNELLQKEKTFWRAVLDELDQIAKTDSQVVGGGRKVRSVAGIQDRSPQLLGKRLGKHDLSLVRLLFQDRAQKWQQNLLDAPLKKLASYLSTGVKKVSTQALAPARTPIFRLFREWWRQHPRANTFPADLMQMITDAELRKELAQRLDDDV